MPNEEAIALQAERRILMIRAQKVMLDFDLAELYGVEARVLNQAVKRNMNRFPPDFMFQITADEAAIVRDQTGRSEIDSAPSVLGSQSVIPGVIPETNSSQIVMSSRKHRGKAYLPYAFTEQGVAMLSSVLRSERAVQVNIAIMRAFVRLRQLLSTNADLARKLEDMEKKYDGQFKLVFDAIRQLMAPSPAKPARELGFHTLARDKATKAKVRSKSR